MLKPGGTYGEGDEALEFYAKHTAQIEVSGLNRGHATVIFAFFFSIQDLKCCHLIKGIRVCLTTPCFAIEVDLSHVMFFLARF